MREDLSPDSNDAEDKAVIEALAKISAVYVISSSIHAVAKTVLDCAIDITKSEHGIVSFYDGKENCIFCTDLRISTLGEKVLSEKKLSLIIPLNTNWNFMR